MDLRLRYLGTRGIIFTSLEETSVRSPQCISASVERNLTVRIRYDDLPRSNGFPPRQVWRGGLSVLWPGTREERKTQDLIIPLVPFLSSFQRRPDCSLMVGKLVVMILAKFSRDLDPQEWTQLAQNSVKLSSRSSIRARAYEWLHLRNRRWAKRKARDAHRLTYPLLNWNFLDLIALAHWRELKGIERRERMYYEMVGKVGKISPDEGLRLDLNHVPTDRRIENHAGFYQYLRKRCYQGFKRGGPSLEELIEKNGSDGRVEDAVSKNPSAKPDLIALSQLAAKLKRAIREK